MHPAMFLLPLDRKLPALCWIAARRRLVTASFGISLLLSAFSAAQAQTTAGSISGTVLDSANSVVPQASVTATNEAQKTVHQTTTNNQGRFVFPVLLPGTYTLLIKAPGFKELERKGIDLNANSVLSVDQIKLDVGSTSQTVQVQSEHQEVALDTAQRSDSIVGQQIQNIQVNGQSPLAFLSLVPGFTCHPPAM
jgi:hypothetical protein